MDKVGKIVEYVQYLIDIYEDIYNNILGPQITNILSWLWKKIVDEIIREAIERLLLYIQKWILDGVEFVEDISRYLMGFKDMTVTSGATRSSDSFLYHVFQFPAIEKIYFGMGMISIPLIMMLTVYKMLPLINEERDRNPISTALRRSAGAFSRILTLWVACTFFLHAGVALKRHSLCGAG